MTTVNNIKELEKYLSKKFTNSLGNEVASTVKDVMQSKVQTEVYDKYKSYSDHPDKYERRGTDGGLKDRSKMEAKVDPSTNTLTVENTVRMADTGYPLAGLIEYGDGAGYGKYDYPLAKNSEGDFRQSRPFLEETRNELSQTKEHVSAMKQGLKRQGINVE